MTPLVDYEQKADIPGPFQQRPPRQPSCKSVPYASNDDGRQNVESRQVERDSPVFHSPRIN